MKFSLIMRWENSWAKGIDLGWLSFNLKVAAFNQSNNLRPRHNPKQTLSLDECSFAKITQASNLLGWILSKQSLISSLIAILTPLTTNLFGKEC